MTTAEPLLPHPDDGDETSAADPGHGAPASAPGTGSAGEEPDVADDAEEQLGPVDTPFRTPQPPS